jgi:hypothetical protein
MRFKMRVFCLVFLAFVCNQACRGARDTVEIMDPAVPPNAPKDDYIKVNASTKSWISIEALSLPLQKRSYERLELKLTLMGSNQEPRIYANYKLGDAIELTPHMRYDVVVSAYVGGSVMYSTAYCTNSEAFFAEEKTKNVTAALCAKP